MEVRRLDGILRYPPNNPDNHHLFYWRSFRLVARENVRRDAGPPIIIDKCIDSRACCTNEM